MSWRVNLRHSRLEGALRPVDWSPLRLLAFLLPLVGVSDILGSTAVGKHSWLLLEVIDLTVIVSLLLFGSVDTCD